MLNTVFKRMRSKGKPPIVKIKFLNLLNMSNTVIEKEAVLSEAL